MARTLHSIGSNSPTHESLRAATSFRRLMRWIERHWQDDTWLSRALLPLSWLYRSLHALNRYLYRRGWRATTAFPVPIVVVGNITVGGTGKTPLVLWIVRFLQERGWRPGIVTRGYRGKAHTWPQVVTPTSDAALVGDEPVLLASRAAVPVIADPDRCRGVAPLLAQRCNIIVSDDGLQHYRLRRDVEIAVIDGTRRSGNGRCLPAGPLREPADRLREVDACVVNGKERSGEWPMQLRPVAFCRVAAPEVRLPLDAFRGRTVHAVAGIGYPPRFFALLRDLGAQPLEHAFADHHPLTPQDLRFAEAHDIIMTEKDAVKCRSFATDSMWYLLVETILPEAFGNWLQQRLGKGADG